MTFLVGHTRSAAIISYREWGGVAGLNKKTGNFWRMGRIQFPYWKTNVAAMTPCENQGFVFSNNFDKIFEQSVEFVIF